MEFKGLGKEKAIPGSAYPLLSIPRSAAPCWARDRTIRPGSPEHWLKRARKGKRQMGNTRFTPWGPVTRGPAQTLHPHLWPECMVSPGLRRGTAHTHPQLGGTGLPSGQGSSQQWAQALTPILAKPWVLAGHSEAPGRIFLTAWVATGARAPSPTMTWPQRVG